MKTFALCLLAALAANAASISPHVSRKVKLHAPRSPPHDGQLVPNNYLAYSIEYSDMIDFAGNLSHPNTYSYQLLKNIGEASGELPIIRPGGSPQNRAFYVDTQTEPFIKTYPPTGGTRLQNFTIGPTWFESFQTFPGIKWMVGLSFERDALGKSQSVKQAVKFSEVLGADEIVGFELGNEIDGFPGIRRNKDWTIQDYVHEWHDYAKAVSSALAKSAPDLKQPLFQGCVFLAPEQVGDDLSYWNVESALKLGLAEGSMLQSVADHKYMGSICSDSTEAPPTISFNLLNHTHTTDFLVLHDYLGNYSASQGVPYVLGETGSVSCHGAEDVSDTYAAAIWAVDYLLYLASLKVSRVYFHQGTGFAYSSWMPVANTTAGTAPFVHPQYYGNLLIAHALSNQEQQVIVLASETRFTAYGIYANDDIEQNPPRRTTMSDSGTERTRTELKLKRVVVINLEEFSPSIQTTSTSQKRPHVEVDLARLVGRRNRDVEVRRLTGPASATKTGASFAGRIVDGRGMLRGRERVESLRSDAKILVGASEAVLISL